MTCLQDQVPWVLRHCSCSLLGNYFSVCSVVQRPCGPSLQGVMCAEDTRPASP